jgi:DNA-binding LacI/PurR family transcriptional regulator
LSIGTVSRYLTGRGYVSAGAQRRIAKAIEDLGYVRSSAASSLRTRRSGIIGFVLSDLRNPFTAQLATAIQEAAREDGLSVFLANTMGDPDRGVEALENLRKHEIDGLIVTPPGNTDFIAASASLRDSGVPVVSVGLRTRPLRLDLVTVDTEAAARECVEHLIGLGHRRIAYLGNDRRSGRYRGYKKALSTAGIPLVPELVQVGLGDQQSVWRAADRVLGAAQRPTAVFGFNDTTALAVIQRATQRGLDVPRDLSVVGFDDVEMAGHWVPPLTTVAQPTDEMGRLAVSEAVRQINDGVDAPSVHTLAAQLVVRDSTAAVN